MTIHDPAHPGEIIREACLTPLGLTVTAAAAWLGVTRKALSDLLNGHGGVSPDMAIRLEKAGWSSAEHWLRLQMQRDLWEARQRTGKIKVKPFPAWPRDQVSENALPASELARTASLNGVTEIVCQTLPVA